MRPHEASKPSALRGRSRTRLAVQQHRTAAHPGRGGSRGRVGRLNRSPLAVLPNKVLTHFAAQRLRELSQVEPQLSADSRIIDATDRALAEVSALVSEIGETRLAG